MSAGPLRRLLGALGLAMLAPIAWRLAEGALDPVEAATRAVVTLVIVVALGRLASAWLHTVASTYDSRATAEQAAVAADGGSSSPETAG